MNIHQKYMSRAIEIARNALGTTAPNPMVGAVIVYEGHVIGEGFTSPFGGPHAEVNAIASIAPSDTQRNRLKNSTLYVTLEPCSHFGKTPPCADLIIEKGIATVVIGLKDPYEKVAGKGIEKLQRAGIKVILGILEQECRVHHKRFLTFYEKQRPYVILKWAETADGFIAPPTEYRSDDPRPVWISHPYSRQRVHQWRSEEQAILVGTVTVLEDDPKLDVRHWMGKNPIRVVLDRSLKTHGATGKKKGDYHVLNGRIPTLILTEVDDTSRYRKGLDYRIMDFSKDVAQNILAILYEENIQSLLVEGGSQTLQTFFNSGLWDEARVFKGKSSFAEGTQAPHLSGRLVNNESVGSDILRLFGNDTDLAKTYHNIREDGGNLS